MLFDAHTHIREETYVRRAGFYQLAVASTPEECLYLERACADDKGLFFACGVHPWRCAETSIDAISPWLARCAAIGEIGMDRTWCQINLQLQRQVFAKQLHLANQLHKPVILHTKGCEAEVLEEIAHFPHPILAHWYSCEEYLEDYLALGCSFSLGPDISSNPAVRRLAEQAPLDRLMVESDGVEGLSWALGRAVAPGEIPPLLGEMIRTLAAIKGLDHHAVGRALFDNAMAFVAGS